MFSIEQMNFRVRSAAVLASLMVAVSACADGDLDSDGNLGSDPAVDDPDPTLDISVNRSEAGGGDLAPDTVTEDALPDTMTEDALPDTMTEDALPDTMTEDALANTGVENALPAAGTRSGMAYTLAGSRVTAGEHPWVLRILSYHPGTVVPGRIYTASCVSNGQRKLFASLATKATANSTTKSGTIVSANIASTGAISGVVQRDFSECKEMNGIAVSADCTTVAAMCRRPSSATGATKDLVASLTDATWKDTLTANSTDDHMWLYEWKNAALSPLPASPTNRYVVSKAIGGGWEYGHQNLVMNGTHYGISMKSTTGGATQHQGDSLVVVSRTSPAIDTTRGWMWACGEGHTLSNRPVVASSNFGALCATDWNNAANDYTKGGLWMHVEKKNKVLVRSMFKSKNNPLIFSGGTGPVLALPGGGYITVIVGSDNPAVAEATKIGLVRLNSDGVVQSTKWIASTTGYFLSYPQIVSLGNDNSGSPRYLVGWGQMMANSATSTLDAPNPDNTQRLASAYFTREIDQYGNAKTETANILYGWGEQDTMVSLGTGMVGWVYIPNARYSLPLPTPHSTSLQFMTYKSTSM